MSPILNSAPAVVEQAIRLLRREALFLSHVLPRKQTPAALRTAGKRKRLPHPGKAEFSHSTTFIL
ncbi:MAG: hypothetical protein EXQ52_06670 [Bryobacterales bacterium]|nr:hypothetical protein [Bryobacterales bacterium]